MTPISEKPTRDDFTAEDFERMKKVFPRKGIILQKGGLNQWNAHMNLFPNETAAPKRVRSGLRSMRKSILIVIQGIKMSSLQSQFLESKGKPIKLNDQMIIQMDRIPIGRGTVKIIFLNVGEVGVRHIS